MQVARKILGNTTRRTLVTFQQAGAAAPPDFRLFAEDGGAKVSPWHDIALSSAEGSFNMLTEIPRFTLPKMEVATKEEFNPISQDIKKGKLRNYHGPLFWNYGCLPQTWEDPNVMNHEVGCVGDNDPLDVVEIGSNTLAMGSISQVKPLGVFSMNADEALEVIEETHKFWQDLRAGKTDPGKLWVGN